ncbi:MAG: SprB repeat-containing protein [Bacteroidetes bacterium]|nr:SprB repeat-containing protein [Bacteroidota bacterium]
MNGTPTDVTTNGGSDGSIDVTATGAHQTTHIYGAMVVLRRPKQPSSWNVYSNSNRRQWLYRRSHIHNNRTRLQRSCKWSSKGCIVQW